MTDSDLLSWISDLSRSRGYPPSVREVMEACGYEDRCCALYRIRSLVRARKLVAVPGGVQVAAGGAS